MDVIQETFKLAISVHDFVETHFNKLSLTEIGDVLSKVEFFSQTGIAVLGTVHVGGQLTCGDKKVQIEGGDCTREEDNESGECTVFKVGELEFGWTKFYTPADLGLGCVRVDWWGFKTEQPETEKNIFLTGHEQEFKAHKNVHVGH